MIKLRHTVQVSDQPILDAVGISPSGEHYHIEIVGPRAGIWAHLLGRTRRYSRCAFGSAKKEHHNEIS